jgi:hypothetical protein
VIQVVEDKTVVGSCDHDNELSDSIKDGEFLYQLSFPRQALLHRVSMSAWALNY